MPCKHAYVYIYMLIFTYAYNFGHMYIYISSCLNLFFYTCKKSDFFTNMDFFHNIWMKASLPAQSLLRHFWTQPLSVCKPGWTGAMSAIWPPLWGLCKTSWWCQAPFLQTDVNLPLLFVAGISHQPQQTGQSLSWHEEQDILSATEVCPPGFLHSVAG